MRFGFCQLAIGLICAKAIPTVLAAVGQPVSEFGYVEIRELSEKWFNEQDVDSLHRFSFQLKDGAKTKDGWPLYAAFFDTFIPEGPPRWINLNKTARILDAYRSKYGEDKLWKILSAKLYYCKGFKITFMIRIGRGNPERLPEAEKYFQRSLGFLSSIPVEQRGAAWLRMQGRLKEQLKQDLSNWHEEVRCEYPTDPSFLADYTGLEPRFGNSVFEEIERRNLPPREESMLYAQLVCRMLELKDRDIETDLFFDEQRVWDGINLLYDEFPSDLNFDLCRFFACIFDNREVALKLFREGPEFPVSHLWDKSEFPFFDWKNWALGEPPFPLLLEGSDLFGVWRTAFSSNITRGARGDEFYGTVKDFTVFHDDGRVQYIRFGGDKNWNHFREFKFVEEGHLKERLATRDMWIDKTAFLDDGILVIKWLSAPYGTTYLEYVGDVATALDEVERAYQAVIEK